jgi:hypothetical protein
MARERKLVTLKSRRKEYKETSNISPNPQTQLEKKISFLTARNNASS